eukprot:scaffold101523_cov20-Tisochrysis_lutea.AAC.2
MGGMQPIGICNPVPSAILTCCPLGPSPFRKSNSLQLKHAAKKSKPQQSPRLHAAFIEPSQAYDTVPRFQLKDHLQHIAMPAPLLRAKKEMYQDDEYIPIDGDERARVHPTQMELSKVANSVLCHLNGYDGYNRGWLCPLALFLHTSMTWTEILLKG